MPVDKMLVEDVDWVSVQLYNEVDIVSACVLALVKSMVVNVRIVRNNKMDYKLVFISRKGRRKEVRY
jgi:hypothetical protein